MLDVAWSELLLVAIAAALFIGPKELPVVVRHISQAWRGLKRVKNEMQASLQEVVAEIDAEGLMADVTPRPVIVDQFGNPQETYDISDLLPPTKKEAKPHE